MGGARRPLGLVLLAGLALPAQAPPDPASAEAAAAGAARAFDWLVARQREDGAWASAVCESVFDGGFAVETYYAYQIGAHGVATLALLEAPPTPGRAVALQRAVRWLATTRLPLRGSDWDNDAVWAALYGTVALAAAAGDRRFQGDEWKGLVHQRGRQFVAFLARNQVPTGGFGYYDVDFPSRRPTWATSFATSCVLPSLALSLQLGWSQDPKLLERARDYVARCRLPNGAYAYDLTPVPELGGEHINDVKGSLGRIQAAHWALRLCGDEATTDERIRWGLERFFEHHRFLHVARMRPVPHEAFYRNASYFYFFGHHYAARCIELLPAAEREPLRRRLRPLILQTQRPGGSFSDTLDLGYMEVSGTAFAAMALQAGLPAPPR